MIQVFSFKVLEKNMKLSILYHSQDIFMDLSSFSTHFVVTIVSVPVFFYLQRRRDSS